MPYCETLTPCHDIRIGIWRLTEELDELLALWGNVALPENYLAAKADKRKREILAVSLLLRHCLGEDRVLHHHADGSPYIEGCNISISHTNGYVAIALHPTYRIGIDIEQLGERAPRVARRFISSDELLALPAEQQSEAIHLCWSAKEALYKLHPEGSADFLHDIHLSPVTTLPSGTLSATLRAVPKKNFTVYYCLYDTCSLAYTISLP